MFFFVYRVFSSPYLFGLTLALSGLCAVRAFHALTQSLCARVIRLLRTCSPHTSSPSRESGGVHENEYFDQIALCCAVLVINGRRFVLKNSEVADGHSAEVGEQKSLRDLAAWLTQKRAETPANAGVAIALGMILHNMAEYDATVNSLSQQRLDRALHGEVLLHFNANNIST